jgi:transposase
MRCELTAFEKGKIVGLHLSSKSIREISAITGYPKSTVGVILKRFKDEGHVDNKPRKGRPPLLKDRDKRCLVRVVLKNRRKSMHEISVAYNENAPTTASTRTLRRNLQKLGFHGRAGVRKPFVSETNRRRRLQWCKQRRNYTMQQWHSIVWSDESRFTLYQTDGRAWVWRRDNEKYQIDCQIPTVKHAGGSVMFWGCCSALRHGPIIKCSNAMRATEYRDILQLHLLPFLDDIPLATMPIFQQDNAPIHTAKLLKNFFASNGVEVLDWCPQSPDLNPIECLWGELEKRVRKRPVQPTTLGQLENFLMEEWENMPVEIMRKFVDSLPRRLAAVIKARGYASKY